MGNAVATYTNSASGKTYDTDNEFYKKGSGFQLGTIVVKNNIFIDDVGATRYSMFATSFLDHSNNIFVPANASIGSITVDATEKKMNLADLGLSEVYKLTAKSTVAIDQGVLVNMTTNAQVATKAADPSFCPNVFTQDYDKRAVPCGAGVDIGASEYCEGGASGSGGSISRPTGTGGANGPDGGAAIGGTTGTTTSPKGTGGAAGGGGAKGTGGASASGGAPAKGSGGQAGGGVLGKGGAASEGGAIGNGGAVGAGGTGGSSSDSVGSGGSSGATLPRGASSEGCSCRMGAGRGAAFPGAGSVVLLVLCALALRRRRMR
jgi:hypothetical protein